MSSLEIGQYEEEGVWQLRDRWGRVELYRNCKVCDWSDITVWRVQVYPGEKRPENWWLCGALRGTEIDARQYFTKICGVVKS